MTHFLYILIDTLWPLQHSWTHFWYWCVIYVQIVFKWCHKASRRKFNHGKISKNTVSKILCNVKFITYNDIMMSMMASQITRLTIVYSNVFSRTDERKHQSSASLTFVRGIQWWAVNSPHKGPVTQKIFPFDDVIVCNINVFLEVDVELFVIIDNSRHRSLAISKQLVGINHLIQKGKISSIE